MAENFYQFLIANEISEAFLRAHQDYLRQVPLYAGSEALLKWFNITKALTPAIIRQAFGADSRLNMYLCDVDDYQNNILHIVFNLLIEPTGCFQLKPRDKLPQLVNELFVELVDAVTPSFSPFFRQIFSQAFSAQQNAAERTAFDILLESGAYQILFAALLFDQKRLSLGSNLNFLHCAGCAMCAAHLASAARQGNFEALCVLLAFDHGPNCAVDGVVPLAEAVRSNSPFAVHTAAALLSASADPNFSAGALLEAPLHFLSDSAAPSIFCELFAQFKADFQLKDGNGDSLLMRAAQRNNFRAVQALCAHGALDCANARGETALMTAVRNRNVQLAVELLQRGRSAVNCVTADQRTVADYLDCTNLPLVETLFGAGMRVSRAVRQHVQRYEECEVFMRQYAKTVKKIGPYKQTNIVQLDAFVTKCAVCAEDFTFVRRRSHCRVCGRIVCRKCYVLKTLRALDGKTAKQKVCVYCKAVNQKKAPTPQATVREVEALVAHISRVQMQLQYLVYQYNAKEHFEIQCLFAELQDLFAQESESTGWREVGQMTV